MQVTGELGHLHEMPKTILFKESHATLIIALLLSALSKRGEMVHPGMTSSQTSKQTAYNTITAAVQRCVNVYRNVCVYKFS